MLFSATLDHGVDEVVDEFLNDPKVHSVDEVTSAVDLMTHHVFLTTRNDKPALVRKLASGAGRRILFTRTKFQAQKLAKSLTQQGIPAAELHGNLNQNQRDRNLQAFESGSVNVLVATDVAARGIDVSGVELVVQVEPPDDPKSFLHRSGRTARAGKAGDVITVITPDQRRYARKLLHQAGIDVKPLEVKPDSPQVLELVGTPAEPVEGWTLPPLKRAERQGTPGKSRNRRRGRRGRRGEDRGRSVNRGAHAARRAASVRVPNVRRTAATASGSSSPRSSVSSRSGSSAMYAVCATTTQRSMTPNGAVMAYRLARCRRSTRSRARASAITRTAPSASSARSSVWCATSATKP